MATPDCIYLVSHDADNLPVHGWANRVGTASSIEWKADSLGEPLRLDIGVSVTIIVVFYANRWIHTKPHSVEGKVEPQYSLVGEPLDRREEPAASQPSL